jgi:hypothetical protein
LELLAWLVVALITAGILIAVSEEILPTNF